MIKIFIAVLSFFLFTLGLPAEVQAQSTGAQLACEGAGGSFVTDSEGNTNCVTPGDDASVDTLIGAVVNTLLFLIGALSVIMLIIGGFRYVVSAGDSSAIEGAKKTIIYALVGLVIALGALAIVNFVLDRL